MSVSTDSSRPVDVIYMGYSNGQIHLHKTLKEAISGCLQSEGGKSLVAKFEEVLRGAFTIAAGGTYSSGIESEDFEAVYEEIVEQIRKSNYKKVTSLESSVEKAGLSLEDVTILFGQLMNWMKFKVKLDEYDLEDIYQSDIRELYDGCDFEDVVAESTLSVRDLMQAIFSIVEEVPGEGSMVIIKSKQNPLNRCAYYLYTNFQAGAMAFAKARKVQAESEHEFTFECHTFTFGKYYRVEELVSDTKALKDLRARAIRLKRKVDLEDNEEYILRGIFEESEDEDTDSEGEVDSEIEDIRGRHKKTPDSKLSTP